MKKMIEEDCSDREPHMVLPPDVPDADGRTPLIHAVEVGSLEKVSALIMAGANIDHQDNNGDTPLHRACYHDDEDCMSLLINAGASTLIRNNNGAQAKDLTNFEDLIRCIESAEKRALEKLHTEALEADITITAKRKAAQDWMKAGMPLKKDVPFKALRLKQQRPGHGQ
jgi:ankyrin repeat protein